MTVKSRSGANFRSGWTWNAGVPYTRVKQFVPCFELEWNDLGMVERTGRHALLTYDDCAQTQQQSETPERFLDDDDHRLCTKDEYQQRWPFLNAGLGVDGKIPERLLSDAESPF